MNILPDLPSELLMVAMQDLETVENDDRYDIDMGNWHNPAHSKNGYVGDYCSVCMAGCVMANTLNVSPNRSIYPDSLDTLTESKLRAIDYIRCGYVEKFFDYLGIEDFLGGVDYDGKCWDDLCAAYDPDDLSRSKIPIFFQIYKNWIVSFIGILQAEGL